VASERRILRGHALPAKEGDPTSEEWSGDDDGGVGGRRRGNSGHRWSGGGSHACGEEWSKDNGGCAGGRRRRSSTSGHWRRKEDHREGRGPCTRGLGCDQGGDEGIDGEGRRCRGSSSRGRSGGGFHGRSVANSTVGG
jgi:hypothetical protein